MTEPANNATTIPVAPTEAKLEAEAKEAKEKAAKEAAATKPSDDKTGFDWKSAIPFLGPILAGIGLNFMGDYFGLESIFSAMLAIGGAFVLGPHLSEAISGWADPKGKAKEEMAQGKVQELAVGKGNEVEKSVEPVAKFTNEELLAAIQKTSDQQRVMLRHDNNHYSLQGVTQADVAQGTKGIVDVAALRNIQAQCGAGSDIALSDTGDARGLVFSCVKSSSVGRGI